MNLAGLEKQIGKAERAAGLGPCEACALVERYLAALGELCADLPRLETTAPRVTIQRVSRCAWCVRLVRDEFEYPEGDEADDLKIMYDALEAGRCCSPEAVAAYDRNTTRLYESLGDRADAHDELYAELRRDLDRLPPPRFPYVCKIAGCPCRHPKRAAA